MKATDEFKNIIQAYLEDRAKKDDLFAVSFRKPKKNIDDCITYIMNTVKESGCNAFADDEIFSMAVHYYDETKIKVGKPIKGKMVINRSVELTDQELKEAKEMAIKQAHEDAYKAMTAKAKKPVSKSDVQQASLF